MKFKIFEKIAAKAAPHLVKAKAASPHIAFGLGIAAVIGGTVYLCKQVHDLNDNEELKELEDAKKVLDETEQKINDGDIQPTDKVNAETIASGRRKISISAKKIVVKKCALAAAIIVVGLGLTGWAHVAINKQKKDAIIFGNAAMAMYNGLANRVHANLSEEDAAKLLFNKNSVVGSDLDPRKVFKDEDVKINDKDVLPWSTKYDILFDSASTVWSPSPVINHNKLRAIFAGLAHRLNTVGHLFFWEAGEALGYDKEYFIKIFGADAGWVRNLPDGTTGTIDYGAIIDTTEPDTQDFLSGKASNVMLHLRPHGMVSNLLKRYDKAKRSGVYESAFEWRGIGAHV